MFTTQELTRIKELLNMLRIKCKTDALYNPTVMMIKRVEEEIIISKEKEV